MEYVTTRFSERLKLVRELSGLTQQQLAEKLGVSRGAISYYEKGERTPDIEFLENVIGFFDLPYDFLLGHTNNAREDYAFGEEGFGLSDMALDLMDADNSIGHIISAFLEHESFSKLKELLDCLLNEKYIHDPNSILYDKNKKPITTNELNYISFLITNAIQSIIFDILRKEYHSKLFSNLSAEKIEEKIKSLEKALSDFDIYTNEMETNAAKYLAPLDTTTINENFSIRKKVHAALGDINYPLSKEKQNEDIT
ncbi:helix-turn-helix domain-containing protein [Hungatella hathewayi]|uniref:helix-turn-helix domain-containing protein n=1 Tax=Hungatella hathewayi TaxID=154046 RepID=UPI0026DD6C2A|nr:helix-turn-helix transcriptional regulator [Hungatella hathewayi]